MKATSTVQVENDRVIVTEWRFAPGADTGHHVHAHDYVVVPLTSGTLRLQDASGVREASLQAGASYARLAGVAHNVINANDFEFRFVEIELKGNTVDRSRADRSPSVKGSVLRSASRRLGIPSGRRRRLLWIQRYRRARPRRGGIRGQHHRRTLQNSANRQG